MTANDIGTNVTATAMLVSPWWLPVLEQISTVAAILTPILAAIWLTVQIIDKLIPRFKRRLIRRNE